MIASPAQVAARKSSPPEEKGIERRTDVDVGVLGTKAVELVCEHSGERSSAYKKETVAHMLVLNEPLHLLNEWVVGSPGVIADAEVGAERKRHRPEGRRTLAHEDDIVFAKPRKDVLAEQGVIRIDEEAGEGEILLRLRRRLT